MVKFIGADDANTKVFLPLVCFYRGTTKLAVNSPTNPTTTTLAVSLKNTMKILLIIAIIYSNICFAQDTKELKRRIVEEFKESAKRNSLNCSWLICNKDSSYYLSDTIRLYNHINYYYDPSNCCEFVKWEFESSSKFRLIETKICKEPPTSKTDLNNLNKINWEIDKSNLYITIENVKKKNKEKFLVCDFYEEKLWNGIHKCMVLKLKRI